MELTRVDKESIELAYQSAKLFSWKNKNKKLNDYFFENDNNILIVAKDKEKVVGSVYGYALERYDTNKKQLFIYSIDVLADYRRQGIAKLLIKEFIKDINDGNYHNAFVITNEDNISAMRLYESSGGIRVFAEDGNDVMFKWNANA